VKVFTTRPETIFGVSYIVLAPEYASLLELIPEEEKDAVNAYLTSINHATDQQRQESKTGQWTGRMAVHPVTHEELPVYIAAYVLSDFGSGAVMGVPRHDARDKTFAETLKIFDDSVAVLSSNHPKYE
jgi:leucyl-tRNA synthetase